jgi:hypothetical protein
MEPQKRKSPLNKLALYDDLAFSVQVTEYCAAVGIITHPLTV